MLGHSVKAPPAVKPEHLPGLIAKMRSAAAPEVAAGAKGLWGLACAGHLALLATAPSLVDSLALVIASVISLSCVSFRCV